MGYIGVQPKAGFTSGLLDRFTSTTGTTVTLTHDIASENDIIVFVNFVKQDSTNYSVGGTGNKTLTLGGTLVSSDVVEVHYINTVKLTQAPSAGSVTGSMMSYPLTNFSSTGIDDNADATAITIDSSENVFVKPTGTGTSIGVDSSSTGFYLRDGGQFRVARDNSQSIIANRLNGDGAIIDLRKDGDTVGQLSAQSGGIGINIGSSATERMRIDSSGKVSVGDSVPFNAGNMNGVQLHSGPPVQCSRDNTATRAQIEFKNPNGSVGTITTSSSSTAYNTSSDYRLKENVDYTFDATSRLKQLKPARFNFKADANTTVDGFLAHEVSSIVPEAISGTKDATETKEKVVVNVNGNIIAENIEQADWETGKIVDKDGNTQYPTDSTWEATKVVPVYQGIDQSKLVPLLTASLKEAIAKIEELETRIATLENA